MPLVEHTLTVCHCQEAQNLLPCQLTGDPRKRHNHLHVYHPLPVYPHRSLPAGVILSDLRTLLGHPEEHQRETFSALRRKDHKCLERLTPRMPTTCGRHRARMELTSLTRQVKHLRQQGRVTEHHLGDGRMRCSLRELQRRRLHVESLATV